MIEYVLGISFYAAVGIVMMGVYAYRNRLQPESRQPDVRGFAVLAGIFWPIAACCYGIAFWWKNMEKLAVIASRQIGAHLNSANMERERAALMDEDLARVGGVGVYDRKHSTEVALRYDYDMCLRCLGSGCSDCNNRGLVRRRLT